MSEKIPATLLMFATSRGHYGCNTIYKATLDYLERQMPLSKWDKLLFHIKVAPGEEEIGERMKKYLESRGFVVEMGFAPWKRGQSHFAEYLKDQVKMSQHPLLTCNPFVYWTDDDYLVVSKRDSFEGVLQRMIFLLSNSAELLSARFLRENDTKEPIVEAANENHPNCFYSRDFNWQPLLMRSRDFYFACKMIEDNWQTACQMHGEALWREVLAPLSRSANKHLVWEPDYAEVANLGCEKYLDVANRFNLKIQ